MAHFLRPMLHADAGGARDEARRRAVDIVAMLQQQQQEAQPDDVLSDGTIVALNEVLNLWTSERPGALDLWLAACEGDVARAANALIANDGMGPPAASFISYSRATRVRRDLAPNDTPEDGGSPLVARADGQRTPPPAPELSGDVPDEPAPTRPPTPELMPTTYPDDLVLDVDPMKTSATLDALIGEYFSMDGSDPPAHRAPLDLEAPPPAGPKKRKGVSVESISEADPLFAITMRGLLEASNLTEYADAFDAHGWGDDHARFLAQLEPSVLRDELEQMAIIVRMNKGHTSRLIKCMISLFTDAPSMQLDDAHPTHTPSFPVGDGDDPTADVISIRQINMTRQIHMTDRTSTAPFPMLPVDNEHEVHDTDADTYTCPVTPRLRPHSTGTPAFRERSIRHNLTSAKRARPDVSRRSQDFTVGPCVGRKRTSNGMYAASGHGYAPPPAPTRVRPPCTPGAGSSGTTGATVHPRSAPAAVDDDAYASGLSAKAKGKRKSLV